MLYLIGLGLGDEKDITVNGLEAVRGSDYVYLEHYTAILGVDTESLEKFYGKPVIIADREMVESDADAIVNRAKDNSVAMLVVGDPFCATTHSDIYLRAVAAGVEVKVFHNASIMNAIGCCGLQLYHFGQTVSIPLFLENWEPDSFYDKIELNKKQGLHTLCLLDIKVKEPNIEALQTRCKVIYDPPRYMTVAEAAQQLLYVEEKRGKGVLSSDVLCVAVARIGQPDQKIVAAPLGKLKDVDMGKPLHSLIVCGEVHPLEEDMLKLFRLNPPEGSS